MYFCAHPDDFAKFFDGICADIFKTQNCAVWYKENGADRLTPDAYETELSQMQLFVAPITANFLKEGAHAEEFAFAIEHNVPVLPIFMADGLEDGFNRRCDGRQALYRYGAKLDTQPYEEKLADFLSSVLVGDEIRRKIREQFDGYIFISYCKEDKRYAQELMRLIHKNACCRDVAVWYDEFLTIGGKFYGEIEDALLKSDLVAFVITPSLIMRKNYVVSTEYPLAKSVGKPLLPVALVGTDERALQDNLKDLPEVVDAYNEREMANRLQPFAQSLARGDKQPSVERDYFIGLAYLTGTDVEIDHARAVKLIARCAELEYEPAMEKLASMYRKGEGVKRNPNKAADVLRKLMKKRLQAYKDEENAKLREERLLSYAKTALLLAECVVETNQVRQYRTAKSVSKAVVEELKAFLETDDSVAVRRSLLECSVLIANCDVSESQRKKVSSYGKTAQIFGLSSGVAAWRQEQIWSNNEGVQNAYDVYQGLLPVAEGLVEKTGELADKRTLLRVYVELGAMSCQIETENARAYTAKAKALAQSLWQETGEFFYLAKTAEIYVTMAAVEDDEEKILEYTKNAVQFADRAAQGEPNIYHRKLLYSFLWTYANFLDGDEKLAALERVVEVASPFYEETGKNDDLNCLASAYLSLVEVECLSEEKRKEYLAAALSVYRQLRSFDDEYASLYQAIINQLQPILDAWV